MKLSRLVTSIFLMSFTFGFFAYAADEVLVAEGETLFTTKEGLGVKIACTTCHKGDKAVKLAEVNAAGDQLPDVINKYVVEKSKGSALAKDSREMQALTAYIKEKHAV